MENRTFIHQGQAEGNRRAAGGRNERPYFFQGALVRIRRRPLCRRKAAGTPQPGGRHQRHAARHPRCDQHAGAANQAERRRELRADRATAKKRSSNTTPVIVLRFEADNAAALKRIQEDFRKVLLQAKPDAVLPY
ncbi:MAG: hypothetical protein NUV75_03665 [Gallionella sp.]|nr:hypothetical protein [Gallionella sp.]